MRTLILKDEFHYNRVPRQTIQMKDFVAFGRSDGTFQIVKNRYTGENSVLSEEDFSAFLIEKVSKAQ